MWTDKFGAVCALLVLSIVETKTLRSERRGGHSYPNSTVFSGLHSYPRINGPSAGRNYTYPSSQGLFGNGFGGSFTVHPHYHYCPPKEIRYTPVHGGAPTTYPVYHGSPPSYVYQYKDSGSKYGVLIAGLALLNLGAITTVRPAYASGSSNYYNYRPQPGEYCRFGVKKDSGEYEEVRIDCHLITSFIILADQTETQSGHTNKTMVTTIYTNLTNEAASENPPLNTIEVVNKLYQITPDFNHPPENVTANANTSVVTTVNTNATTVTDALDVKGKPIAVTPGMQCFLIRHTLFSNLRRIVPCGLLQAYAETVTVSSVACANARNGNSDGNYKPQPDEFCKFGINNVNGDFEQTRIDCKLIDSLILQADQTHTQSEGANKTIALSSVTNFITLNIINGVTSDHSPMNTTKVENNLYQKMPDGTFLPVNVTVNANGITSVVTTVTTNATTVTDAMDVKSNPITDIPGMQCFVIRHTPVKDMRKTVPCHLLQTLGEQSLKSNSAARDASAIPYWLRY